MSRTEEGGLLIVQVISDLLKPERQNLTIKEDRKRGVFVDGLSEWVVRSPQEVLPSFHHCSFCLARPS
jgi:hypothetical protein